MVQALLVVIAIAAALFAYLQVAVVRQASRGDLLRSVGNDLNAPKMRQDRARVYSLAGKPLNEWSAEDRQAAEQVAAGFAIMGLLVRHGYVENEGYSYWSHNVVLCYQIIEPLIEQRRQAENVPSHFIYFEWLARTAYEHLQKGNPWWMKPSLQKLRKRTLGVSSYYDLARIAAVHSPSGAPTLDSATAATTDTNERSPWWMNPSLLKLRRRILGVSGYYDLARIAAMHSPSGTSTADGASAATGTEEKPPV